MKNLITAILLLLFIMPSNAFATIDIVPQKIVMEARDRGGEFTVLNLYNKTSTFRVELISYKQNEDGIYKKLDMPLDKNFNPDEIVRFSPRQFSLPSGGRQKVRLSLRKPSDLPEGEYRFHVKTYRFATASEREGDGESVQVLINTSVVIPVIVRHGNTSSKATLANANIIDTTQTKKHSKELHLDILREGTASTVGQLEVFLQGNGSEKEKIGEISNANVFTDITKRRFQIPLKTTDMNNGTILVRYNDATNKGKILDEIIVQY